MTSTLLKTLLLGQLVFFRQTNAFVSNIQPHRALVGRFSSISDHATATHEDNDADPSIFYKEQRGGLLGKSGGLNGELDMSTKHVFFKRAKQDNFLTPGSLRLAFKDFRVKMTLEEAEEMIRKYDDSNSGMIKLEDFQRAILEHSTAGFWLTIDPNGETRKFMHNASKLSHAGLASVLRKAHTIPGVLSLLVGLGDLSRMAVCGMSHAIPTDISQLISLLHCSVAVSSLARIEWEGFPFQGHQSARRNVLLGSAMASPLILGFQFTELSCNPGEQVLMSLQSEEYHMFQWAGVAVAAYMAIVSFNQGGITNRKTGLLGETRMENLCAAGLPMLLIFVPELVLASKCGPSLDIYQQVSLQYPQWIPYNQNWHNMALFANNLLAFLATALHYDIISKNHLKLVNNLTAFGISVYTMEQFFFGIGDGFFTEWLNFFLL